MTNGRLSSARSLQQLELSKDKPSSKQKDQGEEGRTDYLICGLWGAAAGSFLEMQILPLL